MKKIFILISTLIVALIVTYNLIENPITVFKNGTVVGRIDLSGKTLNNGLDILERKFDSPIYLNLDATSRAISLRDIGINYNVDQILKATKICRFRNPRIFCANTSNEPVDKNEFIKVDSTKLNAYLDEFEKELQPLAKNNIVSFEDYSFRAGDKENKLIIDRSIFTNKLDLYNIIDTQTIKIKLNTNTFGNLKALNQQTLVLIENITIPLLIKYGRNPIYIQKSDLKKFILTEDREGITYGKISAEEITKYLETLKVKYAKDDVVILTNEAANAIQNALLFRATDYKVNKAVVLPLEGAPKTNGELSDVYLEVDKAQQRLYRFEHGKLVKTYIVSTGLTWETPAGEFKILGKQKMAISYFGNWYMPNYLPIGTINGGYRFGFHAIPYHMDVNGNIYSRDENTMGSPATGGCIQLTLEESKELFDWAAVGTPVYIYE